ANHDGVRLYWRLDGAEDRPVLLLLNSLGTDMSLWDRAAVHLLGQFRLLRMDVRGHGASDAPAGDYRLDELARDALAVMDRTAECIVKVALHNEINATRTPFNAEFQSLVARYAWHEIWGRPGLDPCTRRLLALAMTVSLGSWEEFRLHVRAGLLQGGFTEYELKEVLMQAAIYVGVPAANTAFNEAAAVMRELEGQR
ncbi:MAG: alpha/beta fold hydrolase, partial [Steroidobacteraceae bacterium]